MQRYKVTYTIPFSPDPELRTKLFEDEFVSSDSTAARKEIYKKYPNAQIQTLNPIRY